MFRAHVTQEIPTFCFLACLESFLAEHGILISQREILKKKPDVYGKEGILGAFSDSNFKEIEGVYGIKTELIESSFNITPKESIFVICAWKGDMGNIHWVRLLGMTDDEVLLMNPACGTMPDKIKKDDFSHWLKRLYKVTKTTEQDDGDNPCKPLKKS